MPRDIDPNLEQVKHALEAAALLTGFLKRMAESNLGDLGQLHQALETARAALREATR